MLKLFLTMFVITTVLTGCMSSTQVGYGAERKQLMLVSQHFSVKRADKDFERLSGSTQKKYYMTQEKRLAEIMNKMIPYSDDYISENRDIHWGVHVYISEKTNASALANGVILVSNKMIYNKKFNDDALAYILAHEMAHVVRDHHRERQSWKYAVSPALIATALVTSGASAVTAGVLHDGSGGISQRRLEKEADLLGLELMAKAGFNPEQAIDVFDAFYPVYLEEYPTLSKLPEFVQAHPNLQKRNDYTRDYLSHVMPMYKKAVKFPESKKSDRLINIQDAPQAMVLINGELILKSKIQSITTNSDGKTEYVLKADRVEQSSVPNS